MGAALSELTTVTTSTEPVDRPATSSGSRGALALTGLVSLAAVVAAIIGPLDSATEVCRAVAVGLAAVASSEGARHRSRRGEPALASILSAAFVGCFAATHLVVGRRLAGSGWDDANDVAATALVAAMVTLGFLALLGQTDGRIGPGRRAGAVSGALLAAAGGAAAL